MFAVVDAAFAQRRKTLRAALAGWAGSPASAQERLVAAGIDPSARGETLDTAAFVRLAAWRERCLAEPAQPQAVAHHEHARAAPSPRPRSSG